MTYTPYSNDNQKFSDKAHEVARKRIYPFIFNTEEKNLQFTSTSLALGEKEKILDGEMGIDRIVEVVVKNVRKALKFTVQERFRRMKFAKWRDITITEWNHRTNLPSELYKINAGIFVYGYFNETTGEFQDAIAVDTTSLLYRLARREIDYTVEPNPRTDQTFYCFKFDALEQAGTVLYHLRPDQTIYSTHDTQWELF